jgi:hypothetical protein
MSGENDVWLFSTITEVRWLAVACRLDLGENRQRLTVGVRLAGWLAGM